MTTADYRATLLRHRTQLLTRYRDELERADEELANRDLELVEQASDTWDAQVLARLGTDDIGRLESVLAALGRLEEGTFGVCTRCDRAISEARLNALPTAELCIRCAKEAARVERHARL